MITIPYLVRWPLFLTGLRSHPLSSLAKQLQKPLSPVIYQGWQHFQNPGYSAHKIPGEF